MARLIRLHLLFGAIGFTVALLVSFLTRKLNLEYTGSTIFELPSNQNWSSTSTLILSFPILAYIIYKTTKIIPEGRSVLVAGVFGSLRVLEAGVHFFNPITERVLLERAVYQHFFNLGKHEFVTQDANRLKADVLVSWEIVDLKKVYQLHQINSFEADLRKHIFNALKPKLREVKAEEAHSFNAQIDLPNLGLKIIRTDLKSIQIIKPPPSPEDTQKPSPEQAALDDAKGITEVAALIYNSPIPNQLSTRLMNYLLQKHFYGGTHPN